VHLTKATQCDDKAEQHRISAGQLLVEAKKVCDEGGFDAFREKFCPTLCKSRAYELLEIATNKKSVEEVRTDSRERQKKSRANKKEATDNSVTVTENEAAPEAQDAPMETIEVEAASIVPQTPEPASKPRSAVKTNDESSLEFTALCGRLLQKIDKQKPDRFAATGIPPDKLARLGKYLMDLAKKLGAKPTAAFVAQGNGTVSAEQSGEDRNAINEALNANHDRAAA
jgi:hypothetical protein